MLIIDKKTHEFVPTKVKDEENPITFLVKAPTRDTMLRIESITQELIVKYLKEGKELADVTNYEFMYQTAREVTPLLIDSCVVGWKNVMTINDDGELVEVPFSKEDLKLFNDVEILNELSQFIDSLAKPSEKH